MGLLRHLAIPDRFGPAYRRATRISACGQTHRLPGEDAMRLRRRAARGPLWRAGLTMKLVQIYRCFCEPTRLRILHLLTQSPLCVCHFQDALGEAQVKISKHLAYLRRRGLVETTRRGNWIIYSLASKPGAELENNLKCLQHCASSEPIFRKDLQRLGRLRSTRRPLTRRVATGGTGSVPSVFLREENPERATLANHGRQRGRPSTTKRERRRTQEPNEK